MTRRAVMLALLVSGLLPATALAAPRERAARGSTEAAIFYRGRPFGLRSLGLQIVRRGIPQVDERVGPICSYCSVSPAGYGPRPSLHVRDLGGTREPEVVLDLYTGGAHCCFYSLIYRWDGHRYRKLRHFWGNPGVTVRDLDRDHRSELVSADDRFNYAFDCYACSGAPVQIWALRHGRLVRVTRRHRRVIAADVRFWSRVYRRARRQGYGDGRGFLAAELADIHLLGQHRRADRILRTEVRRGHVNAYRPRGAGFAALLNRRLRRWGYR